MRLFIAFYALFALSLALTPNDKVEQFLQHLPYSVEEVDRVIVKDFLKQEVTGKAPEELLSEFAIFKK